MSDLVYDLTLGLAPLAMDALVVSIVIGMVLPLDAPAARRFAARPALAFGGFQAGMVALGWAIGTPLMTALPENVLRIIVFAMLLGLGLKMAWEAWRGEAHEARLPGVVELLGMALATSVDALGAGISLRLLGRDTVVQAALTIGLVTAVLCLAGTLGGRALGRVLGRYPLVLGALVLWGSR